MTVTTYGDISPSSAPVLSSGVCIRDGLVVSKDEAERIDHGLDAEWLESFSGLIKVRNTINLPDNWEMILMDQASFWDRHPDPIDNDNLYKWGIQKWDTN